VNIPTSPSRALLAKAWRTRRGGLLELSRNTPHTRRCPVWPNTCMGRGTVF